MGQKFTKMKEYLLLFRNASSPNGYLASSQDMAEDMPKWQSWIGGIAMQGKLVHTAPMEYAASLVSKIPSQFSWNKTADTIPNQLKIIAMDKILNAGRYVFPLSFLLYVGLHLGKPDVGASFVPGFLPSLIFGITLRLYASCFLL